MSDMLEHSALERWQRRPLDFIQRGAAQSQRTASPSNCSPPRGSSSSTAGRPARWSIACTPNMHWWIKKTGKSATAAMHVLTTTLVFGGRYAEAFCCANDFEQAVRPCVHRDQEDLRNLATAET